MTKASLFSKISLAIVVVAISSCSNPQKDFQKVEDLQVSSVQNIQNATDTAAKIKVCDTMIAACQDYIKKYPRGEWNAKAKSTLDQWEVARASLVEYVNEQSDFAKIQELQSSALQVFQSSSNFAVRLKACTDMVSSLQAYLSKYKTGDWVSAAQTMLMSWQSRKATLGNQLSSLSEQLYGILKQDAIKAAVRRHSLSDIETMTLQNRQVTEFGSEIQVTDNYFFRMKGRFVGTSIFKLNVIVTGVIIPESREVKATSLKVDE